MNVLQDAKKTALVVIDLQNGIVGRPGLAPHAGVDVVARARELADALRARGGTVVWVHVLLNEIVRTPADAVQPAPTNLPAGASELVDGLGIQPEDVVVAKRQQGAFYGTNLEQALDRRGIETIVMAGIATNLGVEATARAAQDAGYALVFAEDAMTSLSAEWHEFSTRNLFPRMGYVRSTRELLEELG